LYLRRYALVSQEHGQQVVDAEELMEHTRNKHIHTTMQPQPLCALQVFAGAPEGHQHIISRGLQIVKSTAAVGLAAGMRW
jgi:hypothetical protein